MVSTRRAFALAAAIAASWFASARADDPAVRAEQLTSDARALIAKGRVADACIQLAEAARLKPTLDATLLLADCYDRAGQVTSGWQAWRIAAEACAHAGDPCEARARERVSILEPMVPRLVVDVQGADNLEIEVRRDGATVGREQWGKPVPVDPGDHVVTANAPGKRSWYATIKTNPNGATLSVLVPPLEDALVQAAPSRKPVLRNETVFDETVGRPAGNTQRLAGVALGAVAVVSLGVGIVFGLEAKLRLDESNTLCRGNACEDPAGVQKREDAKRAATVSTIGFSVGGAAAVGGLLMYFLAPRDEPAKTSFAPIVGPSSAALELRKSW